jgi:hypothetical protein
MTQKYHGWKVNGELVDLNQTRTEMKTRMIRTPDPDGKESVKSIEEPIQVPVWPKGQAELVERNFQQLTTILPGLIQAVESEPVGDLEYHVEPGGQGSVTVRPRSCLENHSYQFGPATWVKPRCKECLEEFEAGVHRSPDYFQQRDPNAKPKTSLMNKILGMASAAPAAEPDAAPAAALPAPDASAKGPKKAAGRERMVP